MRILKTFLSYVFTLLLTVGIFLAVLSVLSVNKFNAAYGKLNDEIPEDYVPITINQSYTNSKVKYNNDDIETTDYLKGFLHEYIYEDIHIVSSISGWDKHVLKRVGDELFKNIHGDEIKDINAVIVEEGSGVYCYGRQEQAEVYYDTPLSFYNFFPENSHYYIGAKKSNLVVSNVSPNLKAEDIAQALSVAYGYHFTQHYMNIQGVEDDKNTEYYSLRANGNENIRLEIKDNDDYINDYLDNYKWYLRNIAAHDYMYLMGSENANQTIKSIFADYFIMGTTPSEVDDVITARYRNGRNSTPHINIDMELPDGVNGLSNYFYSFVSEEAPEYIEYEPIGKLDVELSRASETTNRILNPYVKKPDTFLYKASWTTPYDSNQLSYTIVKYNMDDEVVCVQGFTQGSNPIHSTVIDMFTTLPVNYGRADDKGYYYNGFYQKGEKEIYQIFDFRTDQEFKIRLIATFPNGQITISEPYIIKYPDEHWDLD